MMVDVRCLSFGVCCLLFVVCWVMVDGFCSVIVFFSCVLFVVCCFGFGKFVVCVVVCLLIVVCCEVFVVC